MVINNKIEGIKLLRAMAHNITIEQNPETGRYEIRPGSGLKEAKDLFEAIMEFGASEERAKQTRLHNRIQQVLNEQDIRF